MKGKEYSKCDEIDGELDSLFDKQFVKTMRLRIREMDLEEHLKYEKNAWTFSVSVPYSRTVEGRKDDFSRLFRFHYLPDKGLRLMLVYCAG